MDTKQGKMFIWKLAHFEHLLILPPFFSVSKRPNTIYKTKQITKHLRPIKSVKYNSIFEKLVDIVFIHIGGGGVLSHGDIRKIQKLVLKTILRDHSI